MIAIKQGNQAYNFWHIAIFKLTVHSSKKNKPTELLIPAQQHCRSLVEVLYKFIQLPLCEIIFVTPECLYCIHLL